MISPKQDYQTHGIPDLRATAAVLSLCLVLPALLFADARPPADISLARKAFRDAIAVAYRISPEKITIQPVTPGLPDNPYDDLNTGPWFALQASFPGHDPGPGGFATSDGDTAFGIKHHGAARIIESLRTLPPQKVVRRLMWMHLSCVSDRLIDDHPEHPEVTPPTIDTSGGGFTAIWYIERAGRTGVRQIFRIQYQAISGSAVTIKQQALE